MNRANEELMDALHRKVAAAFSDRLDDPDNPITHAELSVLIRFLKDNGVTSLPDGERISGLGQRLNDAVENDGFNIVKFRREANE